MMMQVNMIPKTKTATAKKVTVSDDVFSQSFNESLVHQVVTAYMAAGRSGTKAQKNRSDVSGGGAKPWAQKGTGRARAGTIRSPLWRGGGKTFAATNRDYSQKVNRKVYKKTMSIIVSELLRQKRIIVLEDIQLKSNKTKELVAKLKDLNFEKGLIVTDVENANLLLASRNIINIHWITVDQLNPVNLVSTDTFLMTQKALMKLEERLK